MRKPAVEKASKVIIDQGIADEEIQKRLVHLRMAETLGLKIQDADDVKSFINAVRYEEFKMADPHITDAQVAEKLGISPGTLAIWKRKEFVRVASQVVLANYLSDATRDDTRLKLFKSLNTYLPLAVENVGRIAAGEKMTNGHYPPAKAQVDAYVALSTTALGQAFVNNLFLGDPGAADEQTHLQLRDSLASRSVVNLDQAVEGEYREVSGSSALPVVLDVSESVS